MDDKKREAEIWEHLQAHPKKAKRLIKVAQEQSIEEITKKYTDVIVAYNATKSLLDGLVADMVTLKNQQEAERTLSNGWSVELQQAYEAGEKEWDRLTGEFEVAHGRQYNAYKQELADCKARFAELQSLLLD